MALMRTLCVVSEISLWCTLPTRSIRANTCSYRSQPTVHCQRLPGSTEDLSQQLLAECRIVLRMYSKAASVVLPHELPKAASVVLAQRFDHGR